MAKYSEEMICAMSMLGQHQATIFLGQAVQFPGTSMSATLAGVPPSKLLELPVAEEMQLGMTNGLAMAGYIPVSIFPRWNFLLLAMNQLVNHLDKMPLSGFKTKAIIRTAVGAQDPLHPGYQHIGDFTNAVEQMCDSLEFYVLRSPADIVPSYQYALERTDGRSTVLVEYGDYYAT